MLIEITNDLYDISSRIKEIDKRYKILYDTEKKVYKLYQNCIYQLTFPYPDLDVRALDYAYDTRIENLDEILKKIDRHNEKVNERSIKNAQDEFENRVSRFL